MITHHKTSILMNSMRFLFDIRNKLFGNKLLSAQMNKINGKPYQPKHHTGYERIDDVSVWSYGHENADKHIFFFHGGAYVLRGQSFHHTFIRKLANESHAVVHYIDYPIAPNSTVEQTIPQCLEIVQKLIEKHDITQSYLMGDSAGAGLALSLFYHLHQAKIRVEGLYLISPWLDTKMTGLIMDDVAKKDSILSKAKLVQCGAMYCPNEVNELDASPLFRDMELIDNVHMYTGTYDILYDDAIRFEKKYPNQVHLHVFDTALHDFPLFPFTKEQQFIIDDIINHI